MILGPGSPHGGLGWTYRKEGHIGEEDGGLDDLLDGGTGLGEDGLAVLDTEGGLLGDGAADDSAIVVHVDLAGAVDDAGGLDGVRLREALCETGRRGGGLDSPAGAFKCRARDLRRGQQLYGGCSVRSGGPKREH